MSTLHSATVSPPGSHADSGPQKWLTLLCVGIGTVMITMESGISYIISPSLIKAFHSDVSTVLWFSVIYMVTTTGLMLTLGWLGDTLGRRRLYLSGFVVFTMGTALVAVSQNLSQLFTVRVFQTIGTALILSNGFPIAIAAFPRREQGRAIGLLTSLTGLGLVGGPWLGGLLLNYLDWRAVYWTRIPLGIVGLLLSLRFLREQRTKMPGPLQVDYPGMLLLYATLVVFLLAMNQAGRRGLESPLMWSLGIATVALVPLLWAVERKAARAVIAPALFKNRVFTVCQISNVLQFTVQGAVTFLASFYVLEGLGASSTVMGAMVGSLAGARIVVGPVSSLLYEKVGSRLPAVGGMTVMAIALLLLTQVGGTSSVWLLLLLFIVIGAGATVSEVANLSAVVGTGNRERLGSISASFGTFAQIGISTGIALGGAVFSARVTAHSALLPDGTGASAVGAQAVRAAFTDAVLVLAGLAALAAVVSWFRGRA